MVNLKLKKPWKKREILENVSYYQIAGDASGNWEPVNGVYELRWLTSGTVYSNATMLYTQ